MFHQPKVNVSNIMKVIDSIKADPEFHMGRWEHCICGHVHRVMGDYEGRRDDTLAALKFLGLPEEGQYAKELFNNGDHRDRDWAIKTLHNLAVLDAVPSSVD